MESADEITEGLVQQILREVEKDDSIAVVPRLLVDELDKDLHGGSCLSRVVVTYTRDGDSSEHRLSLIVKVTPKIPFLASSVGLSSMFPRELQMFEEILPRMSALLARAMPDRHTDFSARVYYTRKDPSYLIAIEDLAPKGFKAPERKKGLDLKHCRLAFRTLARFHAASVMINKEDESLFQVFKEHPFQEKELNQPLMDFSARIVSFVIRAVESWPEFGPSWAKRLQERYETINEDLKKTVWKRNDSAFNVLNHGDFGIHNLMFRHSESGEVEAIMLVDFQCCCYNSPVLDIHQILFSSATDDVRANHTHTLLSEYHRELISTLELLGAPKEDAISFPQLLDEFESKMLYGVFYAVSLLPFVGFDSEGSFNPDDVFNVDNGATDKLQSLISDEYSSTLKRLLPIFSDKKLV